MLDTPEGQRYQSPVLLWVPTDYLRGTGCFAGAWWGVVFGTRTVSGRPFQTAWQAPCLTPENSCWSSRQACSCPYTVFTKEHPVTVSERPVGQAECRRALA